MEDEDVNLGGLVDTAGDFLDKALTGYSRLLSVQNDAARIRYQNEASQIGLATSMVQAQSAAQVAAIRAQGEVARAKSAESLSAIQSLNAARAAAGELVKSLSPVEMLSLIGGAAGLVFAFLSIQKR